MSDVKNAENPIARIIKLLVSQASTMAEVDAALAAAGVSIRNEDGTFRNTYDVLCDLGRAWDIVE